LKYWAVVDILEVVELPPCRGSGGAKASGPSASGTAGRAGHDSASGAPPGGPRHPGSAPPSSQQSDSAGFPSATPWARSLGVARLRPRSAHWSTHPPTLVPCLVAFSMWGLQGIHAPMSVVVSRPLAGLPSMSACSSPPSMTTLRRGAGLLLHHVVRAPSLAPGSVGVGQVGSQV
jgi:hypothetical protein